MINNIIKFKASLIAFKVYHLQTPTFFLDDFITFVPTSSMTLREGFGRDSFMFSIDGSEMNKQNITYLITKQWNSLPLQLRKITEISSFKKFLKTYLFEMQ